MSEAGYFGDASVIESMSEEHRFLWATLLRACGSRIRSGMRVLDFGCGNGTMLAYLMRGDGRQWHGCHCSLGVGIDTPALAGVLAEASARVREDLPIILSSSRPEAFPEQFDLVVSHEVIYLLPDLEEAFRGLHAALAPGGFIALATGCHAENPLYRRWMEALVREGVHAHPYGISEYLGALRHAGFVDVEETAMRMEVAVYEEWVAARAGSAPNPDWFATTDEERVYYTDFGKALFLGRRAPHADRKSVESSRERP
jgi:SAM-dependent methyltransferase